MFQANCYNVMIVSPSDVQEEREIAKKVLYRWNEINSRFHNIVFSVLGYDINAHADSGKHPQESLNHQLLEQADLIIAIFWTKLGSPTTEYSSGSVEEISRHIQNGKKALVYFIKKKVSLEEADSEQYKKLKDYKRSIQGNTFYKEASTEDEFEQLLKDEIQLIANELEASSVIPKEPDDEKMAFSEMEMQLLTIMREKGHLAYIKMLGGVNVGGYNINDRRVLAEIEEAVENLEIKGLIKPTSWKRELFELTAAGYRVIDQIKS